MHKPKLKLHRLTILRELFGISLHSLARQVSKYSKVSASTLQRAEMGQPLSPEVELALQIVLNRKDVGSLRGFVHVGDILDALTPLLEGTAARG